MRTYSLTHLSDRDLLRELTALLSQDCATTALLLAHLAEVDARKLYLPAAYPSMHAYCVHELRLSEDSASKRIRAARAARDFPALFTAVAQGRLHLSAVVMLAPHLTPDNADELILTATHQTKAGIELFLTHRFPKPDLLTRIQTLPGDQASVLSAELGDASALARMAWPRESVGLFADSSAPGRITGHVEPTTPYAKVAALSPQRFAVQFTMEQEMHDKLRYAQALLGHQVPSGDVVQVLERALDALIGKLEQRKFAATSRPRSGRSSGDGRYIPARVRHAVWERDQGQCTFTSETGHRCGATKFLEFDHIDPVARGGRATVEGLRLCCRAHNQYEADRVFGTGFMENKRAAARSNAADRRARRPAGACTAAEDGLSGAAGIAAIARTAKSTVAAVTKADGHAIAEAKAGTEAREQARDVMSGLMNLGVRAEAARRAAEYSEALPVATLEERIRAAIGYLRPKRVQNPIGTASGAPSIASAG